MPNLSIVNQGTSLTDNLFIESFDSGPLLGGTIISGEGVLTRGSVLGLLTPSVPTTGTADGGNTGDGTMTAVAAQTKTKNGVYTMTCTAVALNSGTFSVVDPDGLVLDPATVAITYSDPQITFLINDGVADYVVGNIFTVTVAIGDRTYKLVDSGESDGSEVATSVLLDDRIDATSVNVAVAVAERGHFDINHLIFGGNDTIATHKNAMTDKGMYTSYGISNPNTPSGT